jgi:hypothetical protein
LIIGNFKLKLKKSEMRLLPADALRALADKRLRPDKSGFPLVTRNNIALAHRNDRLGAFFFLIYFVTCDLWLADNNPLARLSDNALNGSRRF